MARAGENFALGLQSIATVDWISLCRRHLHGLRFYFIIDAPCVIRAGHPFAPVKFLISAETGSWTYRTTRTGYWCLTSLTNDIAGCGISTCESYLFIDDFVFDPPTGYVHCCTSHGATGRITLFYRSISQAETSIFLFYWERISHD